MIVKPYDTRPESTDPRQRAGQAAERQMAHYLQRAFAQDPDVHVLHGLRLVDPEQPEADGSPGVCQIDHLVVHQRGMFIVESKAVSESVRIRPDGSGGDEWSRVRGRREEGMRSPIQQAKLQRDFLRAILQRNRADLLARATGVQGVAMKLLVKTDQRGFSRMPIQLIVAVSDDGRIEKLDGWQEPTEPLRVFVCKADVVTERIRSELAEHASHGGLLQKEHGDYGVWRMLPEESAAVAQFLVERHTPRARPRPAESPMAAEGFQRAHAPGQIATAPHSAACKECVGSALNAHWGKYGYYWKCAACGANTPMPVVCSACGAKGSGGKVVRIRKSGPQYVRVCEACGTEERVWTNTSPGEK